MVFAGMPGLHRLLYVSRQALMAGDADLEIGRIVHQSIHYNRQAAVTGLLLSHQDWFVQVLEGPGSAVMETFARISGDPRHKAIWRLTYEKASGRLFADWDMCARSLNEADDVILAEIGPVFDPTKMQPARLLALLVEIANQQRAALAA